MKEETVNKSVFIHLCNRSHKYSPFLFCFFFTLIHLIPSVLLAAFFKLIALQFSQAYSQTHVLFEYIYFSTTCCI